MYQVIRPPAALLPYVRSFWVFEGNSAKEHYVYRSMADGCAELIFHYKGVFEEISGSDSIKQFSGGLHAQTRHHRRFITHHHFGIFGVYLYPYTIPLLFHCDAHESTDLMPDLESLLGKAGSILTERMMLARSNEDRAAIMSGFLEQKLLAQDHQTPIQTAIRKVIGGKETGTIPEMARTCNLSVRHFERKFKEQAGFSPKLYMRLIRFQQVINSYHDQKTRSLTELAYRCGYYDQAHFIHEFRQFSGYHPREYFHGKAEGIEWREG